MNTNKKGSKRRANRVEVIINPVCIRFSLFEREVFYHFASHPDAQLDMMERLMGVEPAECGSFADSNLGFLPVASTVLIRGEKNILVDPGNHHIGFYGMLGKALRDSGADFPDIDIVVVTHWHHDHFHNAGMFPGAELVVGEGELDFGRRLYGDLGVRAITEATEKITAVSGAREICAGITAVHTPGHSPGSISVIAERQSGRAAITGDTVMTREQFEKREFSRWYTDGQKRDLNRSIETIMGFSPATIIPGHDREFAAGKTE